MKLLKGFFDIISILVFYVCPISGAGSECSLADFAKDLGDSLTFTTRDGIELQVVVKGRQRHPTILFLHGFPDCWLSWKNQIPFFVNRGYRTAALSLRGYAESDKPKGVNNYALEKLVEDVKETVTFLRAEQVYLVGHDWGGTIASAFAILYPKKVKKLVLINTIVAPMMIQLVEMSPDSYLRPILHLCGQYEFYIGGKNFSFLNDVFNDLMKDGSITMQEMVLRKCYIGSEGSFSGMSNYYRALENVEDTIGFFKQNITVATNVIWGQKDPYIAMETLEYSKVFVENLTVFTFPENNHFVHIEASDEVNKIIFEFVN